MTTAGHIPVLRDQVVRMVAPKDGSRIVDGTFGAGGYSEALLTAGDCRVWGIDRDPDAAIPGRALRERFPDRFELIPGPFGDMAQLLAARGVGSVDGIALDLGVSSIQLDRPERGFSFRFAGPLDMRMSQEGRSAADLVNTLPEAELADLIYTLGEERFARAVARAVVRARPIGDTATLASVVRRAVPHKPGEGIDPATRTFQAIRIAVNDELGELARGLAAAERLLAPGGRLAVVTFHSLEDRPVKLFLQRRSGRAPSASRHLPEPGPARAPSFRLLTNKPLVPDSTEIAANPRARSAKLRAAERTAAPPWPADLAYGEAA
jgi:16S rRNA (cytosine1402-N4)-methyltransferase